MTVKLGARIEADVSPLVVALATAGEALIPSVAISAVVTSLKQPLRVNMTSFSTGCPQYDAAGLARRSVDMRLPSPHG